MIMDTILGGDVESNSWRKTNYPRRRQADELYAQIGNPFFSAREIRFSTWRARANPTRIRPLVMTAPLNRIREITTRQQDVICPIFFQATRTERRCGIGDALSGRQKE